MTAVHVCPKCGAELPAGVADQPCPACLMQLGLASWGASQSPADPPETQPSPVAPTFEAPAVEQLEPLFPQLDVLELLGKGGMGAVYKARQKSLDRIVALKIVHPLAARDPNFAERFTREAKSLARLNHPNIVTVHDFGRAGDVYYFIMEFVDGASLRQLLRSEAVEPQAALQIVPSLCEALQYAHDEGIVHRDIKPENILIDSKGRVKIADFGLAKLMARGPADITLTEAHQAMGTLHYMAPEQLDRPQQVDHRADIYSLGVTLYEMLTGELPLGRFAPPSKKVQVDVRLDEVVLKTLEREPEKRYQHAGDVKTAIQSVSITRGAGRDMRQDTPPSVTQQVRGPARGLIATGVANWLGMPIALLVVGNFAKTDEPIPEAVLGWLAIVAFVTAGLMIYAGLKMMRCQAYRTAVAASVLAMLITPGNLLGFPIGLWSLVVLSSREVKTAFRRVAAEQVVPQRPPSRAQRVFRWAVMMVSGVLLTVAGLVSLALGWALTTAGSDAWWWYMCGGFAATVAGVSWIVSTWSHYRRLLSGTSLMEQPGWFWLDWLLIVYALVGAAILAAPLARQLDMRQYWPAIGLAAIALIQSAMALIWRSPRWRKQALEDGQQLTLFNRRLLILAVAVILSMLLLLAGLVSVVLGAFTEPGTRWFWAFITGGGGLIVAGGGSLLGMYRQFRHWAGE